VFKLLASVGIALGLLVGPAAAQELNSVIHFSGLAFEEGHFPPSYFGESLTAVGNITQIQEPLFWSPSRYSYTFHIGGLMSLGEAVYGTIHVAEYVGGELTIHVDGLPSNAAYGTNPPNATSPATFMDGPTVYLQGYFSSFVMTFNTQSHSGSVAGKVTFTGGNAFPQLTNPVGWTVGAQIGYTVPAGYDVDWNGALYVSGPLATEVASWGQIKSLYR
jgi:hypothetical protein